MAVDSAGVLVIVVGLAWATWGFATGRSAGSGGGVRAGSPAETRYRRLRQDVGRGILLGLEFMVAGDIIRTVAVEPTVNGLIVLGGIVLIRTFLSLSLEVELEGRWPWQPREAAVHAEAVAPGRPAAVAAQPASGTNR
ncbi:DUF1622 domain-containing protein [Lysobacter lacus]|uniref:DUF1622 domain-containing protein n=2 Tax=Cognatilysobacter lacus TaxID=1643323 RepID=A0A5D8Z2B7_9GAMM|nr:DUF1622 domain-containing protein [Lysobacter lacus]